MSRFQIIDNPPSLRSYKGETIKVGSVVQNIESGWTGQVINVQLVQGEAMIYCHHICDWTSELESDDEAWYAPEDCILSKRSIVRTNDTNSFAALMRRSRGEE